MVLRKVHISHITTLFYMYQKKRVEFFVVLTVH